MDGPLHDFVGVTVMQKRVIDLSTVGRKAIKGISKSLKLFLMSQPLILQMGGHRGTIGRRGWLTGIITELSQCALRDMCPFSIYKLDQLFFLKSMAGMATILFHLFVQGISASASVYTIRSYLMCTGGVFVYSPPFSLFFTEKNTLLPAQNGIWMLNLFRPNFLKRNMIWVSETLTLVVLYCARLESNHLSSLFGILWLACPPPFPSPKIDRENFLCSVQAE